MVPVPKVRDLDALKEPLPARCLERLDTLEQGEKALPTDLDALRDLPAVPFEACDPMPGRVSSTALVCDRLGNYSAPAIHACKRVMVKGCVGRVEIALGAEIVARHRRSYVRGDVVYDPLRYLSLLERKPGALDQAPLRGWRLDPVFDALRRLLEDFPERQVMAQILLDNRQPNRRMELHAVHPAPLAKTDKGP